MRSLIRYVGIGLTAVGLGIIVFWLYLTISAPEQKLTPVPGGSDIEIIYITPSQ